MPSSSHENDLIFATTQAGVPCCLLGSLVQIEEGTVFLEDAYAVDTVSWYWAMFLRRYHRS